MNELTIRPRADDHIRGCVHALATVMRQIAIRSIGLSIPKVG
ncbi:hypothetical protein ABZ349_33020 [Streptomyces niveus]